MDWPKIGRQNTMAKNGLAKIGFAKVGNNRPFFNFLFFHFFICLNRLEVSTRTGKRKWVGFEQFVGEINSSM